MAFDKGDSSLKELLTSGDWIGEYRDNHVDVDYINTAFSSDSESDGASTNSSHDDDDDDKDDDKDNDKDNDNNDPMPQILQTKSNDVVVAKPKTDWNQEYYNIFSDGTTPNAPLPVKVPLAPSVDMSALFAKSPDYEKQDRSVDMLQGLIEKSADLTIAPTTTTTILESPPTALESPPTAFENKIAKIGGKKRRTPRNREPVVKEYVEPTDMDVLMGRGGRSNHHPGNKRYRDEVLNLQKWYKSSSKTEKTDLSQLLVDYVHSYGARFLKLDEENKRWYIVTNIVARRKASQALRELITPEKRAAKKAEHTEQQPDESADAS